MTLYLLCRVLGSSFWTGGNRPPGSGFQWSDSSVFEYINWAGEEPDEDQGKSCVHMGNDNGKWVNNYCASHLNWICKIAKGKRQGLN